MSESRPDIPIPEGLPKLMQDFVVTVLRQQPDDLLNHAVEYFNNLKVCFFCCFFFIFNPFSERLSAMQVNMLTMIVIAVRSSSHAHRPMRNKLMMR